MRLAAEFRWETFSAPQDAYVVRRGIRRKEGMEGEEKRREGKGDAACATG